MEGPCIPAGQDRGPVQRHGPTKPTVPAADGSGNKVPTLEYFRDEFLKQLGVQPEQLVAVSVPDSMEEADQTRAISAVLEQVAENDNLYIDLSGGMRDTATLLLIVARYLKDIRMVQTKKCFTRSSRATVPLCGTARACTT